MPPHGRDGDDALAAAPTEVGQEFRARLMLILGATRRLLNSEPLTAAQQVDLKTIQRNGNELLDLVSGAHAAVRPPDQRPPSES
jgi:hypothetical protein